MHPDHLQTLIRHRIHEQALRQAEIDRREAIDDFWRGADAAWARVQLGLAQRISRSARRLQARLDRRAGSSAG